MLELWDDLGRGIVGRRFAAEQDDRGTHGGIYDKCLELG